mmetsp:Transcript_45820/g.111577  ORF Transcript_45820/g.111577 Transcript_45820/m.111577 type:complete len:251 (+) Transcript_45820:201-953(+)
MRGPAAPDLRLPGAAHAAQLHVGAAVEERQWVVAVEYHDARLLQVVRRAVHRGAGDFPEPDRQRAARGHPDSDWAAAPHAHPDPGRQHDQGAHPHGAVPHQGRLRVRKLLRASVRSFRNERSEQPVHRRHDVQLVRGSQVAGPEAQPLERVHSSGDFADLPHVDARGPEHQQVVWPHPRDDGGVGARGQSQPVLQQARRHPTTRDWVHGHSQAPQSGLQQARGHCAAFLWKSGEAGAARSLGEPLARKPA